MNEICVALGDCGGYVNYLGKYTDDGYDWLVDGANKKIGDATYGYSTSPTGRAISLGGLNALVVALAKGGSWITGMEIVNGLTEFPTLDELLANLDNPKDLYLRDGGSSPGNAPIITSTSGAKELVKKVGDGGPVTPAPGGSSMLSGWLGIKETGKFADTLATGVQWAAIAYAVGYLVGGLIGFDANNQKALSLALAAGALTWKALATSTWAAKNLGWLGAHPLITGIGVAVVVFLLMYKTESKDVVVFNCNSWQAPIGGGDCETCNKDAEGNPCSQYRCKSLGQACELLNAGSEEERCTWVNPRDVKSPGISPWEDVLTPGYEYTDVRIRPPGDGSEPGRMTIQKQGGGCVKAWTALEFGITTIGPDGKEEPAQCKLDYNHTMKFDDMSFWFGESNLFRYNHSQIMNLPSPDAINAAAPELQNDGTYSLYARCQDANGNQNIDEFVIRFCVDKGPDVTPPKIESTDILNGMPVQFGIDHTDIEVYVNEPAECKWSRQDKAYNEMENQMQCSTQVWEMNNQMLYTCRTTLTGIEDRKDNDFYFRCKDQPWAAEGDRNVNQQSYKFTLKGTEPLTITKVLPNGTISGSTTTVPVELYIETENGYNNGDAICYFSTTNNEDDYLKFFETESNIHKQQQDLVTGNYKYYFKCVDLGGNTDYNSTQFNVEVDKDSPVIARVYEEDDLLKIVTTEPSDCSFSIQSCNFQIEDGANMPYTNQKEHFAEWKTDTTYYIKCTDAYGNQPNPAECSMIVRPYNVARD